jgi:hypothetical protein
MFRAETRGKGRPHIEKSVVGLVGGHAPASPPWMKGITISVLFLEVIVHLIKEVFQFLVKFFEIVLHKTSLPGFFLLFP